MKTIKSLLIALPVAFSLMAGNAYAEESVNELKAKIAKLEAQVAEHKAERAITAKNLKTFDELDLVAFNNRDIELIKQIHAVDVKVYNPDGTITQPAAPHIEELE